MHAPLFRRRLPFDAIHLAGLDERGDDRPVLGSGVVACEGDGFPVQGDGPYCAFDGVAVDAAVGQEATEASAVLGDVGQCLAKGRFSGIAWAVGV